uniref:Uncharacterized protein n=1 Tax=Cacopsylla melanoneura TaxID=428564 RepID=A0A8D8Z9K3_9HEMI
MLYQLPCSSFASNLVCLEKSSKLKLSPGSPELSFHSVLFLSIFSASLILSSSFCSLNRDIILYRVLIRRISSTQMFSGYLHSLKLFYFYFILYIEFNVSFSC